MMTYKKGYKYQLVDDYRIRIEIFPEFDINTRYIQLSNTGILTLKAGYAWDGPSGPTFDTKNFMRGSLVHDALYQLLRGGELSSLHRNYIDCLLREICLQDDMSRIRAWYVYKAVVKAGGYAASPKSIKKIISI